MVEILVVIGGIGVALGSAMALVVVRARRRRGEEVAHAAPEREAQRQAEEKSRLAEDEARIAAEQEVRRQADESRRRADEEARDAAQREAERQAEESRGRAEEEARVAAEQEAQRQAEEARRRAEEEARVTAEQEAERQAEESRGRAEEEARVATEQEAQRQAEEARLRAEEESRAAAERETQRQAEEARLRAEEESRVATEQEAQRQAEEARLRAEEESRVAAEQEAQRQAEEARPRADEGAHAATEQSRERPRANQDAPVRVPRQYRSTARVPGTQRSPASPTEDREARDRAMPIEVRLLFERAGFCRVSLLPRRGPEMPAEFTVVGSGDPPELLALQDEWYQDVLLPDLESLLRDGIEWAGTLPDGCPARLSLSGRDLYVLARHNELNGFVSTPRLILDEEHVVLCTAERLSEVRAAITLTESPEPALLNSDSGIPSGWVGLRGVVPRRPIAPSPDGDLLDAIRPLAQVVIALEGGIRIDRQTWLSGFPPTIRLLGETSARPMITIDGQEATLAANGGYVVPGWDSPGEHSIWCTSSSRTYGIRSGAEDWEPWDAYAWSLGEPSASGMQSRPGICGVLIRPPRVARPDCHATVVIASNPILIGPRPGDLEMCAERDDLRAGLCVGFPWFEPVWAIPANALHCDRRAARVLLIGPPRPVEGGHQSTMHRSARGGGRASRQPSRGGVYEWCAVILTASRKGLLTEPSRPDIADLWSAYRRSARAILRRWR